MCFSRPISHSKSSITLLCFFFFFLSLFLFLFSSFSACCAPYFSSTETQPDKYMYIGLLFLQSYVHVSLKSEVPLLALRESPALFFFGQVPNVRVPRGRCHRTVHDATVVQKFSVALLRQRSLCSVCFPKNSTDVGRNKQFPTPCTCTGTRSAGASVGYMMPLSVVTGHFDNPSRSLSRPVVDQSLPNTGQRIVIVCCPSFPWHKGARRETVAIDPRGGFPEDELFVCSFSVAAGPTFFGLAADRNLP